MAAHSSSGRGMAWRGELAFAEKRYAFCDAARAFGANFERLPHVLRLLLENTLRHAGSHDDAQQYITAFQCWLQDRTSTAEIPFLPNRIIMHDTTCGPALVDIAAMRDVLAEHGVDPALLNPSLPVDVSTDHSSGVDYYGTPDAFARNLAKEFARNGERYSLMKWAMAAMPSIRVHPPGSGIMHTINLERLSNVLVETQCDDGSFLHPDMVLGTDSHTPMVNGLGILGWGVGGLEAEGTFFGVPTLLRIPDVVGVRLEGKLPEGVMATDMALAVTERLRQLGVSGDFIEFFGPGVTSLSVGERGAVANMAPEYGATTGFFPVDEAACAYLGGLGRPRTESARLRAFYKQAHLWFDPVAEPFFTRTINIDLASICASIAGPRRPQDRRDAGTTQSAFNPPLKNESAPLPDGAVAIAAITSCTNTSDLRMLIAAGLIAKKAHALGLKPPDWVKTSLAPGSPAAGAQLARAGLLRPLEAVGFSIVGYGCTTCIGNSGALSPAFIANSVGSDARAVAVLSGNRNFPGRVHPDLEYGFLASPPMVIAFALAGHVNLDITKDPIGKGASGEAIVLSDIWPSGADIDAALAQAAHAGAYDTAYEKAAKNPAWQALSAPEGPRFPWNKKSTYLRRPPFVSAAARSNPQKRARALLVLGDDITTDHISPANQINAASEAGRHIIAQGGDASDLNVFAARRGNFEVMLRGAFSNRLVENKLSPDAPAGFTRHAPSGDILSLVQASERYRADGIPLVIFAGERYGMGSSRDWAAKAVALLGVRAVIAQSIERIHRSNLIGMGVLPLVLPDDISAASIDIAYEDEIDLDFSMIDLRQRAPVVIRIHRASGEITQIVTHAAVETALELELLRSGGMIPYVLRKILAESSAPAAMQDTFAS